MVVELAEALVAAIQAVAEEVWAEVSEAAMEAVEAL